MGELAKQLAGLPSDERELIMQRFGGIATIEGRALSSVNVCMIGMQNPSATIVGGFRQWLNAGRCVRKGETGLAIWVPIVRKVNGNAAAHLGVNPSNQPDSVRFMLGTVFDISQTAELPTVAVESCA